MTASFLSDRNPGYGDEPVKHNDERRASNARDICVNMRLWLRLRARRIIIFGCILALIWILTAHRTSRQRQQKIPFVRDDAPLPKAQYGGNERSQRLAPDSINQADKTEESPDLPANVDDMSKESLPMTKHYYDGAINLDDLASTMRYASRSSRVRQDSSNVLFCASNLQAVAALIPIACGMAQHGLNEVHMAFMGRSDISISNLLLVNSVEKSCQVTFHDARPDFAIHSTDLRAETSVIQALGYIQQHLYPQAVLTYSSFIEDEFFNRAAGKILQEIGTTLIQIPYLEPKPESHSSDNLAWVSRLDARALGHWNEPEIEIVVGVKSQSAGNVLRLLDSLSRADYVGSSPPQVTIDLPSEADETLMQRLRRVQWPPETSTQSQARLIIRRRIPIHSASVEESSVRFMESFFPTNPDRHHLLVLSSDSIVSPLYYQALRYYLLRLKYSRSATVFPPFMGIALDLPSVTVDGSKPFVPPRLSQSKIMPKVEDASTMTDMRPHFFWQAPNTNAALYFGNAWKELHSFVSYRLTKVHAQQSSAGSDAPVNRDIPAWSDMALEFMQVRGLSMFYPGAVSESMTFVTTTKGSRSASQPPEAQQKSADTSTAHGSGAVLSQPLIKLLPFVNREPTPFVVPHLKTDGSSSSISALSEQAKVAAERFRQTIGGCKTPGTTTVKTRKFLPGSARDLFCFGDEEGEGHTNQPSGQKRGLRPK